MPTLAINEKLKIALYLNKWSTTRGCVELEYDHYETKGRWEFSTTPRQYPWQFWRHKYTVREAVRLGIAAYEELCQQVQEREDEIAEEVRHAKVLTTEVNRLLKTL